MNKCIVPTSEYSTGSSSSNIKICHILFPIQFSKPLSLDNSHFSLHSFSFTLKIFSLTFLFHDLTLRSLLQIPLCCLLGLTTCLIFYMSYMPFLKLTNLIKPIDLSLNRFKTSNKMKPPLLNSNMYRKLQSSKCYSGY